MFVSLIFSVIIYMFIAMFSGMVMQSVIEEKSSRVVEVLVSSVKATELMFGKIIGVACVALTQFFLWIVLTGILVTAAGAIIGFDSLAGSATVQTEQINQMTEGLGADPAMMQQSGITTAPAMPQGYRLSYASGLIRDILCAWLPAVCLAFRCNRVCSGE